MIAQRKVSLLTKLKINRNSMETKRNLFVAAMLALPILGFLIFWVYIHLDSFLLAFQIESTTINNVKIFSLDNFKRFFSEFANEGNLPIAVRNTLIFFVANTFVSFPIAIFVSYFIYKKIKGYKLFRVVSYLPAIITSSALVVLYKEALINGGPVSNLCKLLNIPFSNPFLLTSDTTFMGSVWAIVIYNITFGIGGNIIVLCGAMNSIDKQVLESGQLDGCSWFRELFNIVLPSIWPTISTILILNLVSILGSTGPILAFTDGKNNTETLSFLMYAYVKGNVGNVSAPDICYASCIGFIMTIFTFPIVLVVRKLLFKEDK